MLPPLPAPKSYQRLRSVFTLKDGSCSSLNGDLYHKPLPCCLTGDVYKRQGQPVHVLQCRNGEQLQSVHEEPSLSAHGSSVDVYKRQVYVSNKTVNDFLQKHGADALPITLVDGEIAVSQTYPTVSYTHLVPLHTVCFHLRKFPSPFCSLYISQ